MRNQIELFTEIDNYQTSAFQKPLMWLSNGKRGYLHTRRNCRALSNKVGLTDQAITLRTALADHTVCELCISCSPGTEQQTEIYNSAKDLDTVTTKIETLGTPIERIPGLPALNAWRNQHLGQRLLMELNKIKTDNGLEPWKEQLRQTVLAKTPNPDASSQKIAVAAEALHWAASEMFREYISGDHGDVEIWGGMDAYDTFEQPIHKHFYGIKRGENPGRNLVEAWINLVQKGLTPETAAKTLLEDDALFTHTVGNPDDASRETCLADESPEPGETLKRYGQRVWHKHVHAAAQQAIPRWIAKFGELTRNMSPAVNGVVATARLGENAITERTIATMIRDLIISTLDWTTIPLGSRDTNVLRGLVVCHPTIATYLAQKRDGPGISFENPTTLTHVPTKENLINALHLWDPLERNSVYTTIGGAIAAAEAL